MKVIYIAGPFRAPSYHVPGQQSAWGIHQNITAAMGLALEVWRLGHVALCPHANTFCFQGAAIDEVWLQGDLELLSRCDAILLTPDWSRSQGARAERDYAIEKGIPVFDALHDLQAWLAKKEGV
jgi:nucleoside 2-deoxyribosyltransferase